MAEIILGQIERGMLGRNFEATKPLHAIGRLLLVPVPAIQQQFTPYIGVKWPSTIEYRLEGLVPSTVLTDDVAAKKLIATGISNLKPKLVGSSYLYGLWDTDIQCQPPIAIPGSTL